MITTEILGRLPFDLVRSLQAAGSLSIFDRESCIAVLLMLEPRFIKIIEAAREVALQESSWSAYLQRFDSTLREELTIEFEN